jgi:hypothetical protein
MCTLRLRSVDIFPPCPCHPPFSWSLDTQVDFAWRQLGTMSMLLVALLVVETVCLQVREIRPKMV